MPPSPALSWIDPIPCPVLIIGLDDGRVAWANRRAREQLGTTSQPGSAAALFGEPAELARLLDAARAQGRATQDPMVLKSVTGTKLRCRVEAESTQIEGRDFALLTLADTPAPQALDLAGDKLRDLWRGVFDQAGVGIVLLDAECRFVEANRHWLDLFGHDPENLRSLCPLGQDRAHHPISALLRGETHQYRTEQCYVSRDGVPFWGDLAVSVLRDSQGAPVFIVGFLLDITARKRAEEELLESNERLEMRLLENQQSQTQLAGLAVRDASTGLFNRRYMETTLRRELSRAGRENSPLSLVVMHVDHFDALNDRHGERAGDHTLKTLAGLLQSKMRSEDVACRSEGEEFVAILPGAPLMSAAQRAESWRGAVEAFAFEYAGVPLRCTLSIGVSEFPRHGLSGNELLAQAASALYMAEQAGRNRVMVWS